MSASIKDKTLRSISWNLLERFGVQISRFVMGIILARLLTPEVFGIVGMITVFFMVAQVFIDSGFGQAYVQKEQVTDEDANTVFYSNLIISVILYIILFLGAPAIANFYGQPVLIRLTRIMGLVVIINAFSIIQIAQLTRAVNLKRKAKITLISVPLSGVIGVICAWQGMGVWSLVIMNLSERIVTTSGLWITTRWKPSLVFSEASFRELFGFGSWILYGGLLAKILDNIYILVIGKLFPMAQLGFYTQAKKFERLTSQQITATIAVVMLPVFSKATDNIPRIQNMMKKFLQQSLVFIVPLLTLLLVNAEPFVILFLTAKWAPMIHFLQILCILGMIHPMIKINNRLVLSMGNSKLAFKLNLFRNAMHIINIVAMYRFGVLYLVLGEVIISGIYYVVYTFFTKKFIKFGLMQQIKNTWKIFLPAFIAGTIGYLLRIQLDNLWLSLIVGLISTAGLFILLQILINRVVFYESIQLARSLFAANRKK